MYRISNLDIGEYVVRRGQFDSLKGEIIHITRAHYEIMWRTKDGYSFSTWESKRDIHMLIRGIRFMTWNGKTSQ